MIGINEELQAYTLLAASANKDTVMLNYLWNTHGRYLWTERHFEPVMRYLIEAGWIQGIEIILRSPVTHDIVKGLGSDERTYFIENMIGDIFEMKEEVQNVLKRELS